MPDIEPSQAPGVRTGIQGLDTIIPSGFLPGNMYLIGGLSGAGKTTLCNQTCFNHVAAGGRAVYITLLMETHSHLLAHLRSFAFFTEAPIGQTLFYYSGFSELEQGGLDGLLTLIQTVLHDHSPTLLVLDSLTALAKLGMSDIDQKRFFQRLQTRGQSYGCAILLTKPGLLTGSDTAETMMDGILHLSDQRHGFRTVREVQVHKWRGSRYLRGPHLFEITTQGLVVHPSTETVLAAPEDVPSPDVRLRFGIATLDEMVGGGLYLGSTTTLMGVLGSGKSLLGLQFLAEGARQGEVGLYLGFQEPPSKVMANARHIGLPLSQYVTEGIIQLMWQPAYIAIVDDLIEKLLQNVETRQVRRLFIDGLEGLRESAIYVERIASILTALTIRLRALGVTTVCSVDLPNLFGPEVQPPLDGLLATTDNLLFLRQVELNSHLYRLISILKMRGSQHSVAIREFAISDTGLAVAATFESAEAILTGLARPLPMKTSD